MYWFGPVVGPVRSGPPGERAGPARFIPVRAGFGYVTRHVGQHDPIRSINGPCLAWPYLYRAETGSNQVTHLDIYKGGTVKPGEHPAARLLCFEL